MTKPKKLSRRVIDVLRLCEKALESCGDNEGSEASDNGFFETYFDDKAVSVALESLRSILPKKRIKQHVSTRLKKKVK